MTTGNIRKKLDSYGAIRPVVKDDKHVRIPTAFLDWLETVPVSEDNSSALKNNLLETFLLLRNQGPKWRWTANAVAKDLKSRGLKLGRNRLQRALKVLKDHGWTRAVVVKGGGAEAVTEFLEVQWRQLPLGERRTKRVVRVDQTDEIRVFEDDGREVPKSSFEPKGIISQKAQDEQDLWHSSRRTKKSKALSEDSPLPPNPVHREPVRRPPVHRGSGHEYNATLSIGDVFPRLVDPPVLDRWSRAESLDWCRNSVKGQLFLQMVEDQDWSPDLARTFTRSPGKWSLADCRSLLRMPVLGRSDRTCAPRISLNDLLRGKTDSERKNPWERMVDPAKTIDLQRRNALRDRLRNFSSHGKSHDEGLREAVRMRDFALELDPGLSISDDLEGRNLLLALLARYFLSFKNGQYGADPVKLDPRWGGWTGLMNGLAASDHAALLLMRAYPASAQQIWGIDWKSVELLHYELAESLNFRAEVYDLKERVRPDAFWFSQEILLPGS